MIKMRDHFQRRFIVKTDSELQAILDDPSRYQKDAVDVARSILQDRKILDGEVIKSQGSSTEQESNDEHIRDLDKIFNLRSFFRSLSHREFTTLLTVCLVAQAITQIIWYYSGEKWMEDLAGGFVKLVIVISFFINHIIYKIEHRRSNSYFGRSIIDTIYVICIFLVHNIYHSLSAWNFNLFSYLESNVFYLLFGIILLIMIFEIFVSTIKLILKIIGWQIL